MFIVVSRNGFITYSALGLNRNRMLLEFREDTIFNVSYIRLVDIVTFKVEGIGRRIVLDSIVA